MARCFRSGFAYPAKLIASRVYWPEAGRQEAAKHVAAHMKAADTNRITVLVDQIPVFMRLSFLQFSGRFGEISGLRSLISGAGEVVGEQASAIACSCHLRILEYWEQKKTIRRDGFFLPDTWA